MLAEAHNAPFEDDFEAVEAAVRETARGRWFLDEFARRHRANETETLLQAIESLGASFAHAREQAAFLSHPPAQAPGSASYAVVEELDAMARAIEEARDGIAVPLLQEEENWGSEGDDDWALSSAAMTEEFVATSEKLQEIADCLAENERNRPLCDEFEAVAAGLLVACAHIQSTSERTAQLTNMLVYLADRVACAQKLLEQRSLAA